MLLQGIFPAVTTPFYPDGAVYYKKIEHNIDRYSRTPIAGMVVLGSTGEAVMLGDDERREVLKVTEYAAMLKYDVALVRTPHFYRPQMKPEAMLNFYRTVADRSPLPVLLYTVPPFTAYDLPLETIVELAGHPNIIGIKESSGNVEKVAAMVAATRHIKHTAEVTEIQQAVTARMMKAPAENGNGSQLVSLGETAAGSGDVAVADKPKFKTRDLKTRTKEVGFQVLVGAAHTVLDSLQVGASGAVVAFAAPAPTICFEIHAAWRDNDIELARSKQQGIAPV